MSDEPDVLNSIVALGATVESILAENAALRAELVSKGAETERLTDMLNATLARLNEPAQPQLPADERVLTVLREILAELVSQRAAVAPFATRGGPGDCDCSPNIQWCSLPKCPHARKAGQP